MPTPTTNPVSASPMAALRQFPNVLSMVLPSPNEEIEIYHEAPPGRR